MDIPPTPATERLDVVFGESAVLIVRGWQNAEAWSKKLKANPIRVESFADAHAVIRSRLGSVPTEAKAVIETGPGAGTPSQADTSATGASFVRVENDRGAVERKAPDTETIAALRAVGLWPA